MQHASMASASRGTKNGMERRRYPKLVWSAGSNHGEEMVVTPRSRAAADRSARRRGAAGRSWGTRLSWTAPTHPRCARRRASASRRAAAPRNLRREPEAPRPGVPFPPQRPRRAWPRRTWLAHRAVCFRAPAPRVRPQRPLLPEGAGQRGAGQSCRQAHTLGPGAGQRPCHPTTVWLPAAALMAMRHANCGPRCACILKWACDQLLWPIHRDRQRRMAARWPAHTPIRSRGTRKHNTCGT